MGSRFNGRDLNGYLRFQGHDATQCVWCKQGVDAFTWRLANKLYRGRPHKLRDLANYAIGRAEYYFSLQSMLYPWPYQLLFDSRFLDRDIIHYHLIHNGYFSFQFLPRLTAMKPSVWTIHDPWAMCGHCVYPYNCNKWMTGCGQCPDLKTFMPMFSDNTKNLFEMKKRIVNKSEIDIVVASKYMLDMANNSPILQNKRIHYIPFGVNLDIFKKIDRKCVRYKFRIPENNLVISFRQTNYEYKGLAYIKDVLGKLDPNGYEFPISIITVNEKGFLKEFEDKFQIVELGIVTDELTMSEVYNCSDVFLMPSTAEAFGMMAVEAMACGTPVIVFDGTALPATVFAPRGGISVPMKDSGALYTATHRLLINGRERDALGTEAFRLSREHYDFKIHADRLLDLYRDVVERKKRKNGSMKLEARM